MRYALLFPGQGSQKSKMMDDFIASYPKAKELFEKASNSIDIDLLDSIKHTDKLNQTEITQPVILVSSYIIFSYFKSRIKMDPVAFAGHSLGEYSSLLAAGSIQFEDAVKLVHIRGKLMQKAVIDENTAMAAILGLDDERVILICDKLKQQNKNVSAVNFNCPGQVVIAGIKKDVVEASEQLKKEGAKRTILLDVSVPSHCDLMNPILDEFEHIISDVKISTPSSNFYPNVSAELVIDAEKIKNNLVKQISHPVLWSKTIANIEQDQKLDMFIECGYNKILTGLNKKNSRLNTLYTSNIVATEEIIKLLEVN